MLSPLAAQNVDVLRAIATGQFTAKDALAGHLGKDASNFRKTLARLEEEELIAWPALAERGKLCLRADDVAAGRVILPEGMIVLRWRQIIQAMSRDPSNPGPLNPRTDWDSPEAVEDMASLRASIRQRGVRHNLQVRPGLEPEVFEIVDGERRWRAVGAEIAEGGLPDDFPLICLVKDVDDQDLMFDAVDANVQARALTEIEEGHQFARLRDVFDVKTKDIAERIGKSQKYVQNRIRLTELPVDLQARMALPKDHSDHLGYKAALNGHLIEKKAPAAPKAEEPPKLELSPKLALALVELSDKAARFPAKLQEPGFTELLHRPTGGALPALHDRKVITYREWGGKVFAKVLAYSSGALTWLEERGFNADPDGTITAARLLVLSEAGLAKLALNGLYATEELNIPGATPEAAIVSVAAEEPAQVQPDPALVEATDETITPAQLLILAEIADKMMREPQRISTGQIIAYVLPSVRDDEAILKPLRWGGYLAYGKDHVSDFYRVTEPAERLLKAKGFHPQHSAMALYNARHFARRRVGNGVYVTPWLNGAQPETNPVRQPEAPQAPELPAAPSVKTDPMADMELYLVAGAFARTSQRSRNVLVTFLTTGEGAQPSTLLAQTEDDARGVGSAMAESGLYVAITIHDRSGKLLQAWGA